MKPHSLLLMVALFVGNLAPRSLAQPAYVLDPEFKPIPQRSLGRWAIDSAAVQADGRILVSGPFDLVDGVGRRRLARLFPDGSLDPSFTPPKSLLGEDVNGIPSPSPAQSITVLANGRILLRGNFAELQHDTVLLDPDGSLVSAFSAQAYSPTYAVLPDGRIINHSRDDLPVRLNADGSIDPSFQPAAMGRVIAVQSDGRLILADAVGQENPPKGPWTKALGWLVRLNADGSLDATFAPPPIHKTEYWGTGDWASPGAVIQPDGMIVVVGHFDGIGDAPRNGVARLHPNGELDLTFNPPRPVCGSCAFRLGGLGQDQNGTLHVLWEGTPAGQDARLNHWFRLNRDGSELTHTTTLVDRTWDPGSWFGLDASTPIVGFLPDGGFILHGWGAVPQAPGSRAPHIVRVRPDGEVDWSFFDGLSIPAEVAGIALQLGGKILVQSYTGMTFNRKAVGLLTRINADGTVDSGYAPPIVDRGLSANEPCLFLEGGKVLTSWGRIVRLNSDGSPDPTFVESGQPPGAPVGYPVGWWSQKSGAILRLFQTENPRTTALRRMGPNGAWDPSLVVSFGNSYVSDLVVDREDRILVCGSFTSLEGQPLNGLARLNPNGTLDRGFDPRLGLTGRVFYNGLLLEHDDRILVWGHRLDDQGRFLETWIKRLWQDGTIAHSFSPSQRSVRPLLSTASGWVIGWQEGNAYGSVDLVRIEDDGVQNLLSAGTVNSAVESCLMESDGSLLIGGRFTAVGSDQRVGLARLKPAPVWRSSGRDTATGRFTGTIGCLPGWKYRVEASADLKQWDAVATGTSAGESVPFADNAPPGAGRRFYRVVRE